MQHLLPSINNDDELFRSVQNERHSLLDYINKTKLVTNIRDVIKKCVVCWGQFASNLYVRLRVLFSLVQMPRDCVRSSYRIICVWEFTNNLVQVQ